LTNLIRVTVPSVGPFDHGSLAGLRRFEPVIERRYTPLGDHLSELLEQAVTRVLHRFA
jgi:hypothetical protein